MSVEADIRRWAPVLRYCTTLLLFALPAKVAVSLLQGWRDPSWLRDRFPTIPPDLPLTPAASSAVLLVGALALLPLLYALWHLRALFRHYERGEVLLAGPARRVGLVGRGLLASAAAGVLVPALQLLALTWPLGPGSRHVVVAFTDDTFGFLLAGGTLLAIGWAMREATRAAEDAAGFI